MIDTLWTIAKMVVALLPFVVLCLAGSKVNLPKPARSKQFLMPVITVVYVIVAMVLMHSLNDWLLQLIDRIPVWIASLARLSWMPETVGGWLLQASAWVTALLQKLNLHFWVFFIANTVIILVYLMVKKIVISILDKAIQPDGLLHTKISGVFYEYFPEKNIWCIRESYVQARTLLQVFYYAALVLSCLLMLVSRRFFEDGVFKAVFYPVFGILVVGELFFYLDGATKREYVNHILGEDEEAYRVVNYSLLRKFLRSLFGDKLLTENTGVNNALSYDLTTDDILRELEVSEDQKTVAFATYFQALNKTGFPIDHNYLYSSLDMLQGKSILFNNPFYNDLIPYAFYPMNRTLLSHRKVLVVLGRHAIEEDVQAWIEKGIETVTNLPFLWRVGVLGAQPQPLDIGIVTRSGVLDIDLHNANAAFLEEVGFVVVLEPSKLMSTAQIGLNLIIKQCGGDEDEKPVYCLCDKNCDGLVDALSHVLMTSLTEVSATRKPLGTSSYMCWDADSEYLHHRLVPNISRYLGGGTELSFAALKNQVSKVTWYGGESFPVTDMRWITRQYYYDLTRYAGLPTSQEALDTCFCTSPNYWSAGVERNSYLTVEDESCNMFEVVRDFSTRTTEQGFINVISSDYLLKEYMADNASIFETDAKAIPYIVADYTRSNRNTILRLVLMMSTSPVSTTVLERELSLLGIQVYDLRKQLWYELYRCYATLAQMESLHLPEDYRQAVEAIAGQPLPLDGVSVTLNLIRVGQRFNLHCGRMETTYAINDPDFLKSCVTQLKSAGYVAEDEKGETYYLGSELSGHIYQKYLPGQFFTFGGKYYEMQHLTADGQVLVRRAADHINGRPAYRQIREYTLHGVRPSETIGSCRDIAGMKVMRAFADISVATPGYYRMERYNDFATAKKISFEGEKSGIPLRTYRNKEILCIELPDCGGKLSDAVRYTVTLLFNEIFRTLFAENQAYICAVTDLGTFSEGDGPLTYALHGDGCTLRPNAVYILEDSQLDLGLTVAVERHLERIFRILHDYIDWHSRALEESLNPPIDPPPPIIFTDPTGQPKKNPIKRAAAAIRRGAKKVIDTIKGWFKKKPKPAPKVPEEPVVPTPDPQPPEEPIPTPEETTPAEEIPVDIVPDSDPETDFVKQPAELAEAPAPDTVSTPESLAQTGFAGRRLPYHQRYYTLYGGTEEPAQIDLRATLEYLTALGMDGNPLKQARNGKEVAAFVEATFHPGKPDARYCDFCGAEIYGVEYETLADGRDRCLSCGRTAIKTGEEFRKIFEDVKRNMEAFFGIRINAGIKVEMVNSKTLHKRLGEAFIPTPKSDGRVLGVAIHDRNGYTLLVENGSPRMASMLTMAHELTHIWQYIHWNDKAIRRKYGRRMRLEIYEGMAKWVEIQYAYLINEPAVAKREEILTCYRQDEYGRGFLRYRANYPFSTGTVITKPTPFLDVDTPLAEEYCGTFTVVPPTGLPTGGDEVPSGGAVTPPTPIEGPIQRTPAGVTGYGYSLLTADEKTVYDRVVTAVRAFQPELTDFGATVTETQMQKILDYIHRDHPEMFWFRHGATYFFDTATRVVSRMTIVYCMTLEEADRRQKEIDAAIRPFLTAVHDRMSDYEVALRIYENIIQLVDYDTIGLNSQGDSVSEPTVPDDLRSIYGVFVNKKAVCAGYAKATQYLLNRMGIPCTYVTSDTHAWNLLLLEGDYYHLDTTWGDGSDTMAGKSRPDGIGYDCFCVTTEEILRLQSHTPEAAFPLPVCTATRCNYHHRHGLFFDTYSFDRVRSIVSESVAAGRLSISLKCADPTVFAQMQKDLITDGRFREAIQYANLKATTRISGSYAYAAAEEKRILTFYLQTL